MQCNNRQMHPQSRQMHREIVKCNRTSLKCSLKSSNAGESCQMQTKIVKCKLYVPAGHSALPTVGAVYDRAFLPQPAPLLDDPSLAGPILAKDRAFDDSQMPVTTFACI